MKKIILNTVAGILIVGSVAHSEENPLTVDVTAVQCLARISAIRCEVKSNENSGSGTCKASVIYKMKTGDVKIYPFEGLGSSEVSTVGRVFGLILYIPTVGATASISASANAKSATKTALMDLKDKLSSFVGESDAQGISNCENFSDHSDEQHIIKAE